MADHLTAARRKRPTCIIDLLSHVGTPATWRSRSHPTMTVCDRHAEQYASAYDEDTRVDDWEPIETEHRYVDPWGNVEWEATDG